VFLFTCPRCHAALRTAAVNGGAPATCPRCDQRLRVPAAPPEPLPDEDGAEAPRRRRPRTTAEPGAGRAVLGWLGERALRWAGGLLSLIALNIVLCGGYLGWTYLTTHHDHRQEDSPPRAVTAAQLGQEYADDAAAADERYRGETLQVTGVIGEVARDGTGTWRVVLRGEEGAGGRPVECSFDGADEDAAAQLAQLQKGQPVTVRGRCEGGQARVRLRDCALID
jgi:hypothetical protein